jgi:hypothetical protein
MLARAHLFLKARHGSLGVSGIGCIFGGGKLIKVTFVGVERFLLLFHSLVNLAQPQIGRRVVRVVLHGFLESAKSSLQCSLVKIDIPDLNALGRAGADVAPVIVV